MNMRKLSPCCFPTYKLPMKEPLPKFVDKKTIHTGNNIICFKGKLVFGPDWILYFATWNMILIPAIAFAGSMGYSLYNAISWGVIPVYLIGLMLLFTVCLSLFLVGSTDPGIVEKKLDPKRILQRQYAQQSVDFDIDDDYSSDEIEGFNESVINPRNTRQAVPTKIVRVKGVLFRVKYCAHCKRFREPRMKHCRECNNCVEKWDHHCPWTGTCIGARNYKYFYMFITSTLIMTLYGFLTTLIQTIILCVRYGIETQDAGQAFLKAFIDNPIALMICMYCFIMMWSLVGLCGLHTYLVATGQTTYEHIQKAYLGKDNPYKVGIIQSFKDLYFKKSPIKTIDFSKQVEVEPSPSSSTVESLPSTHSEEDGEEEDHNDEEMDV